MRHFILEQFRNKTTPASTQSLFYEDSDGELVYLPDIEAIKHPYKGDPNKVGIRRQGNYASLCRPMNQSEAAAFKRRWMEARLVAAKIT